MPREINQAGYELIKEFEGKELVAYLCPAGVWTIGYGHTGPEVRQGVMISDKRALELLDKDLDWAEECVDKTCPASTENERAAMVSLTFNIGAAGFKKSTVARLHNAGDKAGAATAFSMWNKATVNGALTPLAGLTRRRAREADLYLTPDRPVFAEQRMPQAVQPETSAASSGAVISSGVTLAAGAGGLAEQLTPDKIAGAAAAINSLTDSASSVAEVVQKVGPMVLAAVVVVGAAFFLIRYLWKKHRGDVRTM